MVEAGELGGILEETLQRVADQLEKDDSLRRQVKSAMMYPSLIGGFALTVLLALVTFLVPVFEKIFKDFGGDLPVITKFTVALSHFVTGQWYIGIAMVVGTIFALQEVEGHRARAASSGTASSCESRSRSATSSRRSRSRASRAPTRR